MKRTCTIAILAVALALLASAPAGAAIGTNLPAGFPAISDASLGTPVLGFGAEGPISRTPVIFLHGNNDTPFPTACNPFYGKLHDFAESFEARGYRPSELWGLGYQGDQCDLLAAPTNRSGVAHTAVANAPDLDRFIRGVLSFTGAKRVDIVAHSLGVTLTRSWLDTYHANSLVRRAVAIAGPNHGIINCSPNPANYFQLDALGGFTPTSAVCREYGTSMTPFLSRLNRGNETRGSVRWLTLYNTDSDFVYLPGNDGLIPGVPAEDATGAPHDFSESPRLEGAANIPLTGQGAYDPASSAHLGIANSPVVRDLAYEFLNP